MFSNFAVLRKIRGQYYFMFQVCERRKHQLVEAHVRLYAVRHTFHADGTLDHVYQCHTMRVQQPDDDVGATLLMALPQVVVHRIDQWSPLFPPECLPKGDAGDAATNARFPATLPCFPDPLQRMVDIENGNRDSQAAERGLPTLAAPTRTQVATHLRRSELEVIVVLEGIDGSTSNTMQARHSYTDEDMAWDATFVNCVTKQPDTGGGGVRIDFDRFHMLRPVPQDVDSASSPSVF